MLTEERYDSGSFTTYHGRALAVVYVSSAGEVRVGVSGETLALKEAAIRVTE